MQNNNNRIRFGWFIPTAGGTRATGKVLPDFQNTQFVLADCKTDARVQRIYGGASEIMRLLISRAL